MTDLVEELAAFAEDSYGFVLFAFRGYYANA